MRTVIGIDLRTRGRGRPWRHEVLTDTEAAYLAGIIDGEGSITVATATSGSSVSVGVKNTNKVLIDWLCERYPCKIAYGGPVGKCKEWWIWSIRGQRVRPPLEAAMPYLLLKRRQAEIALTLISISLQRRGRAFSPELAKRRQELFAEIRELNRRGHHE